MQQSKMAVTGQPIKVFNNGNMLVPLVPWTYFSPLGWNAKQIPPGLSRGHVSVHWGGRDFTYVDDIVEGVTRVIDNPPSRLSRGQSSVHWGEISERNISPGPAPGPLDARVSEGGTTCPDEISGTEAAPSPQHNAISKGADNVAPQNTTEKDIHKTSTDKPSALSSVPYAIYNIGNSSPVQLMEYIGAIEQSLNKTAKKKFLPMQPGDVPRTEADVTDLVENLGYKPNTPVATGIERFIKWYKHYFSRGDAHNETLNFKLFP